MGGGPGEATLLRRRPHAYVGVGGALVFALLFLSFAALTRTMPLRGSGFTVLWPAGGLPIAWMLVRGARVLGVDTAILVLVSVGANLLYGASADLAVVFGLTNVVQTWVAVVLVRRWCPDLWGCGGDRALDRPRAVGRLGAGLGAGMVVGTLIGSLATVVFPAATGEGFDLVASGLWFGRNLASAMIVVAPVLLVGQRSTAPPPRPPVRGAAGRGELVLATVFTVGMYTLAFTFDQLPLAFPLLAATVWFAVRFSTVLTSVQSFLVGIVTVVLTVNGVGPFSDVDQTDVGFMIAQFYVATIAVMGLAIATGRDEHAALAVELRRTREDAVYQDRLQSAVIGAMAEGVLVVDDSGELLVHNESAARLLGVPGGLTTESRLALSSWTIDGDLMTSETRPTARALRGERVEGELMVVRVDDAGERILTISAIPLPRDEVNDRARAMVLMRDSTTEHAHREELAAFAGVVAHDLRNPLATIDGWNELLADELEAGTLDTQLAHELVDRVRSASRRMRELIRDLLAHATSSARDLEVRRVDVAGLVAEIAGSRHAERLVTAEPVPPVLADPLLARQVFDNLIGNALKYVAPGVEAEVVIRGARTNARLVTIEVVDNGIGIPEEDRERIFDEFHRSHFEGYEGSGLGLSIVRRIVHRHGGTIEADANPAGQGSVFRLTLPAYDGADSSSFGV